MATPSSYETTKLSGGISVKTDKKRRPVIIVHGGAWAVPNELTSRTLSGVERAATKGYAILLEHGNALDAVEEAIKELERDSVFDAGYGSVLNADGEVEMDAAIMSDDGVPRAGGVAGVSCFKHPISVARHVHGSEHVLLTGKGAERFGKGEGVECVDMSELVTEGAKEEWRRFGKYSKVVDGLFGCDTVGAVAMDEDGFLAAGTSTGGITYKRAGRVGDSAIVGAGLWVECGKGGVSCTGHGESILLSGLARGVVDGLAKGLEVDECCRKEVWRMGEKTGGRGGAICVDLEGCVGFAFSTKRMSWASYEKDGRLRSGIDS